MRIRLIISAICLISGFTVGRAIAADPHDIEPSLTLDQADVHYGDGISFTSTYPKINGRYSLHVRVLCSQEGQLVYQYSTSEDSAQFILVSELWTGGAAHCEADLYYFTYTGYNRQTAVYYLDHVEFEVAA